MLVLGCLGREQAYEGQHSRVMAATTVRLTVVACFSPPPEWK